MKTVNLKKEYVGLAGEYAVASELCKRGFYSQLTLGNHKKTDLLIETDSMLGRVSVKAKTGVQWPKVTGIWASNDLLVFVDFKEKTTDERPDFYVLRVNDWKKVIKKIQKERGKDAKIDNENTLCWKACKGSPKGWRGCAIEITDVEAYKESWPC